MITESTQLIFLDEWSAGRMDSDMAKTVLQGGWMVTAVKHGLPRSVDNNSPFYITTNEVPDFGKENENVMRRIAVYTTKSLPRTIPGIDRWLYDHAMHCIAWLAREINEQRHLVDDEELWYEDENTDSYVVQPLQGHSLWNQDEVERITEADLLQHSSGDRTVTRGNDVIHPGFAAEVRKRKLARRKKRRRLFVETSSTDEHQVPKKLGSCPVTDESSSRSEAITAGLQPDTHDVYGCPPTQASGETERESGRIQTNVSEDETRFDNANLDAEASTSADTFAPNPDDVAPENDEVSNTTMNLDTPQGGWILNDVHYMAKVVEYIEHDMNGKSSKAHVHSFLERSRKAELRHTTQQKFFWEKSDPEIDAWMLATGRVRDIFDLSKFVSIHTGVASALGRLRQKLNLRVHPTRCPVQIFLKTNSNQQQSETNQIPSKSLWATVKNWITK